MQFPLPAQGLVLDLVQQQGLYLLHLHVASPTACCPNCKTPCSRVHSFYWRTLDDAPCAGQQVRLRVRVRRFRCEGIGCPRRIFAERLPDVAAPFARRTTRCAAMLLPIALALGGEAAARLLPVLGLAASPSTLLRLILKAPEPQMAAPRVLGVDDWALRRGSVFGTILVDLEKHKVVDLLPDRTVESLAEWLRHHPGVEIVSRDRSGAYAQAITEGAPDAIQVADRWHLLKNNLETLERVLQREPRAMVEAASPPPTPLLDQPTDAPAPEGSPGPAPVFEAGTTANDNEPAGDSNPREPTPRTKRIYEQIQALANEGLSENTGRKSPRGTSSSSIYAVAGKRAVPTPSRSGRSYRPWASPAR